MSERRKGITEVRIFEEFVRVAGLPIEIASIRKCLPPRPDICCRYEEGGWRYFELTELCDETIARLQSPADGDPQTVVDSMDAIERIVTQKLHKLYSVNSPVELLCYKLDRLMTPDTQIVELIKKIVSRQPGPFSGVWFYGEHLVQQVWCRAGSG